MRHGDAILAGQIDVNALSPDEREHLKSHLFTDYLPLTDLPVAETNALLEEQREFVAAIRGEASVRVTGDKRPPRPRRGRAHPGRNRRPPLGRHCRRPHRPPLRNPRRHSPRPSLASEQQDRDPAPPGGLRATYLFAACLGPVAN